MNLGVNVLIGFIVVLTLPGGPLILKLTQINLHPHLCGIIMSPINGF